MWGEITYPFLNFNGCTVEVLEWISNFTPYFILDVITYSCWNLSQTVLVKGIPAFDTQISIQLTLQPIIWYHQHDSVGNQCGWIYVYICVIFIQLGSYIMEYGCGFMSPSYTSGRISQMQAPLAAYREPAGSYNRLSYVLYVFEHKTQYLLIHAPYTCTHIVVFWHIFNMFPWIL